MAKPKQKITAHNLYVRLFKSQKEIAETLGVTEKTISTWAREGNWKAERNARHNGTQQRSERIKEVISSLTEDHLAVLDCIKKTSDKKRLAELRKESASLSQEIAIQTKALERMDKDHKISLSTYLEVMEDIFKAMQNQNKEAYIKTLDFQSQHIQYIAQKLG